MSEKEAKKVFLKQAKPFFKRFETEQNRKKTHRMVRRSFGFTAGLRTRETGGVEFVGSYEDLFRGRQLMRVPVLFDLPGVKIGEFTTKKQFDAFKAICEDK